MRKNTLSENIRKLKLRILEWDEKRYSQSAEELGKSVISRIPHVGSAYLYGSGAVKQVGYSKKSRSQLDIVVEPESGIGVKEFTLKLLRKNPQWSSISSWLTYLLLPEKMLEPSSCITYCWVNGRFVKLYITGNIEQYILENGTRDIAGRFSKKMVPLVDSEQNTRNLEAKKQNQRNTLASALVLIKNPSPTLEDVGIGFNKLSYMGEFRNLFGMEKRDKAEKSYRGEKDYYDSIILENSDLVGVSEDNNLRINYSKVFEVLYSGPKRLREKIEKSVNEDEELIEQIESVRGGVENYHTYNNLAGSTYLAVKNFFTTGPVKSVAYVAGKARKAAATNLPYLASKILSKTRNTSQAK